MSTITHHGHSAVEIELGGKRIWIDPFLTGNSLATVTHDKIAADVIAITHGHSDHVGDAVAIAKRTGAPIVATYELACFCGEQGVKNIEPGNIGGTIRTRDVAVTFTMAWHSSALEAPGGARYMGPSTGLVIKTGGKSIYHMGDTGLFSDIKLIAERYGPFDVAFVPCGDRFTMGLDDAVIAAKWINARLTMPIHYGTFPIIENNGAAFADAVNRAGGRACCPASGERVAIP